MQQFEILKQVTLDDNDIVIFYDGGNDFWQGVVYGNTEGTIIGYNIENKNLILLYRIKSWLGQNSSFYNFLSTIKNNRNEKPILCLAKPEDLENNFLIAADAYSNTIKNVQEYLKEKNITFFHFYQPTLLASSDHTEYEKIVMKLNPCYSVVGKFYNKYTEQVINKSQNTIDLSKSLIGKGVFIDWIHIPVKGNLLIAEIILNYIDI